MFLSSKKGIEKHKRSAKKIVLRKFLKIYLKKLIFILRILSKKKNDNKSRKWQDRICVKIFLIKCTFEKSRLESKYFKKNFINNLFKLFFFCIFALFGLQYYFFNINFHVLINYLLIKLFKLVIRKLFITFLNILFFYLLKK